MTRLSVELPNFTSPGGVAERIRFQDTANGLVDATDLRTLSGDAIITRLQINGDQDRCFMQIVATLGDTPTDLNPSLSTAWELYDSAITLQATGVDDLVISGPNAVGSDSGDTSEPYVWEPGSLVTYTGGLEQWVADFKAAYASDNTLRATMVLDDGETTPLFLPAVGPLATQIFQPFTYTLPSATGGNSPYQYFLGGLPAGFSFDSSLPVNSLGPPRMPRS